MGSRRGFSNIGGCRDPAILGMDGPVMGWSRRKRTAWAAGLSAVLHVLMLTGMVVGLKVVKPPPEGEALELTLIRPLRPPPKLPPPAPEPQTTRIGPQARPRPAPAPPPGVPTVALPPAPAAPPVAPRVYGPAVPEPGVRPSLSGRMGCDEDPLARKEYTEGQKQTCANNLTARAKAAPQLPLNISGGKLAEYERNARCHQAYGKQGIPSLHDDTDASVAPNLPSALPKGLGNVPAPKDCGFGER
jgi:hypothetical protein